MTIRYDTTQSTLDDFNKNDRGYLIRRVYDDPKGRHTRRLHCLIVERALNCCLLDWSHVHHINGKKRDNRLENLQAMTNSQHSRHEGLIRVRTRDPALKAAALKRRQEYNRDYHKVWWANAKMNRDYMVGRAQKKRLYRQHNRAKVLEQSRLSRQRNHDRILETGRLYYQRNRTRIRHDTIDRYYRNHARVLEVHRVYRQHNRAKINERQKNLYHQRKRTNGPTNRQGFL